MKKILVLLVAACCLFVSCEKEGGNSSLDGTTWKCETTSGYQLVFDSDYVSSYEYSSLVDTQTYKVKGDKISFGDYLSHSSGSGTYYRYDKVATLNSDKTRLTIRNGYIENGEFIEYKGTGYIAERSPMVFVRVIQ